MNRTQIKFPLTPTVALRLPKGSRIVGVSIRDDITFLNCDLPDITPLGVTEDYEPREIVTFLAGEKREGEEQEIPIPAPSAELRLLGVVETVETPATWHVFERTP